MSSKRRRNQKPDGQTNQSPENPGPAPYTLQQLMHEHGEEPLDPTPKEEPAIKVFHDHRGNVVHVDASEVLEGLESGQREELSAQLELAGFPHDEETSWPEPGDMCLTPAATPEDAAALADALLHEAGIIAGWAREDQVINEAKALVTHLGCLSVNYDDLNQLLTEMGSISGSSQPSKGVEDLLRRFKQLESEFEEMSGICQEVLATAAEREPENRSRLLEPDGRTPHLIRIRAKALTIRHCVERRKSANTVAERAAYSHWVFDLYHNAHRHWHELESNDEKPEPRLKAATAAMDQCLELWETERKHFNDSLDTKLGHTFDKASPQVVREAQALQVETLDFECGVITGPKVRGSAPPHNLLQYYHSYLAFQHRGTRYIQGIGEPYPQGYPAELAQRHMQRVLEELDHPDPILQAQAENTAVLTHQLAEYGLHSVTPQGMRQLIARAQEARMSMGAIYDLIESATGYDGELAEMLVRTGGTTRRPASRKQAKAVLQAARQAGLDEHQLADIAGAMRQYDLPKAGIWLPKVSHRNAQRVIQAATEAEFPQRALLPMHESMTEPE